MPPRLSIWTACRALSIRTRALATGPQPRPAVLARGLADDTTSRAPGHGSGSGSRGDPSALPPSMTPASEPSATASLDNEAALDQLRMIEYGLNPLDPDVEGHKYGLPDLPLPSEKHAKHRYDAVIVQITKLLMKDGKLAKAQRVSIRRALWLGYSADRV